MTTVDKAKEKIGEVAKDAKAAATEQVETQTEHLRDQAVAEADRVSDAAGAASREFEPDSLVGQALRDVRSHIDGLTSEFQQKPAGEMLDDVAVFARRNPLLFLGGAAVLGFAAARFLKSSAPERHDDLSDPWAGHLDSRVDTRAGYTGTEAQQ